MKLVSRRLVSAAIVFVLCISMFAVSSSTAGTAADTVTPGITYTFDSDENGSAGGTITLCSDTIEGEVELYWGTKGLKLDGYSPLASVTLEKNVPTDIEVQAFTSIPSGAYQLITYYNGSYVGQLSYTLPASKRTDYGNKLYSFGVVSDVHLPTRDGSAFDNALAYFQDYGCSFVGVTGDLTNDGNASELAQYQSIVSKYDDTMPVYAVSGNHDAQSGGIDEAQWETYTGHPLDYTIEKDGDVFIFLGDTYWRASSNGNTIMTDEQLDWLEEQLEANKDKTVYLFQHVFLGDTCGDIQYENGTDVYGNWFDETKESTQRYRDLLRKYNNVTWFNGHSHWKFYLQYINENLNVFNGGGEYCNMVHVPSVTVPRDFINQSRVEDSSNSEGYIVDVYENKTVLRGYDFQNGQYDAYANYVLDNTVDTTPAIAKFDVGPNTLETTRGKSYQLNIDVVGRYGASEDIIWTSSDSAGRMTVDSDGVLTVPDDEDYGSYTLTATSAFDASKTASITINVGSQDGSYEHPYLISSAGDFIAFSASMDSGETYAGKYLKQTCDIDLTGTAYNGCTYTDEFLGVYDGNGYAITANISNAGRSALFGYIGNDSAQGVLMNVQANVISTSAEYGSGLAYSVRPAGLAVNCYAIATIEASGRASALFSSVYGYVYNCYGTGSCTGSTTAGVAAQWNNSSDKMKHNYYLDTTGAGSSATSDTTALASVTAADLKSADFLNTLNSNLLGAQAFLTEKGFSQISAADLSAWVAGTDSPDFANKEGNADISSFILMGISGQIDGTTITVKLPAGTDVSALSPEIGLGGQKSVLSPHGQTLDFSSPKQFVVTAENGLTQIYTVKVELASAVKTGDVDEDGSVTVSDVVALRSIIMLGSFTENQLEAGDLDQNKSLTVSDVVELRDYIMKGIFD